LEQALSDIGFKDKEAVQLHIQLNTLTFKDICTQAEDAYRMLFDRMEWPPAQHSCDSKAPPVVFGNLATSISRAELLNLIQAKPSAKGAGYAKKGVCFKCIKPGHWSREYPENRGKGRNSNGMKEQRMSSLGSPLCLHRGHLKSSKSTEELSTGVQAASAGPLLIPRPHTLAARKVPMEQMVASAINNVSLTFDPSVWTFENKVTPGVADDCPDLRKECLSVEDTTMKKMHIFCGDTRVYLPRG
jgi:hypothetical protein